MFTKIYTLAALGLLLTLPAGRAAWAAEPAQLPTCCTTQTRCCEQAKFCCDQPEKAKCCLSDTACCNAKDCCGSHGQTAHQAATCPVTGLNRTQCCAKKGESTPPCCQKGCDTPGRIIR